MAYYIVRLDGVVVGFGESGAIGALEWFAHNVFAYSMDHAIRYEGYSVEEVEEVDCREVSPMLAAIAARHGITMSAVFVPFSKSRNAHSGADGKTWESLNWRVTLTNGRQSLETDYSQGTRYAPSNRLPSKTAWDRNRKRAAIAHEMETGSIAKFVWTESLTISASGKPLPAPGIGDVLHSLVMDSDVLDFAGFESWASEFGYDTDSRSAESTYRQCVEIALQLRQLLGPRVLKDMRALAQFN